MPNKYMDGERGAGKTFNLVQDIPDGGILVVATYGPLEDVRRTMLHAQGRSASSIRVCIINTVTQATRELAGIRRGIVVGIDHDMQRMPHLVRKALRERLAAQGATVLNAEALG